jgi:hypothetical protein
MIRNELNKHLPRRVASTQSALEPGFPSVLATGHFSHTNRLADYGCLIVAIILLYFLWSRHRIDCSLWSSC